MADLRLRKRAEEHGGHERKYMVREYVIPCNYSKLITVTGENWKYAFYNDGVDIMRDGKMRLGSHTTVS